MGNGQFQRVAERDRKPIRFTFDGAEIAALEGDTLLTAILLAGGRLRDTDFAGAGDGPRAGFCLMGACQDCWVWQADGRRLRACTTYVAEGQDIRSRAP